MVDLVIGGSTYKNIGSLQVKQTDGGTATFRQWNGEADKEGIKVSAAGVISKVPEIKIAQINKNFNVSIKEGQ